jgi:hypothetical protein
MEALKFDLIWVALRSKDTPIPRNRRHVQRLVLMLLK